MKRFESIKYTMLAAMLFVLTGAQAAFAETPEVVDESIKMPDLTGMSYDSVLTRLNEVIPETDTVHLVVMPDSFYTDSIPAGTVMWQEPLSDSVIIDSIKVRLAAPTTVEVPDVLGMQFLKAKEKIEGVGLVFFPAAQRESSEYPAGTVMLVAPQAGTVVTRGESITIITSAGKPDMTPVTTSEGVEVHLYGDIDIGISSVSVVSEDSSGFVLEFGLRMTNPYEHWIEIGKIKCDMQLNKGRIAEDIKPDGAFKINPGKTVSGKIRIPVLYTDIPPAYAQAILGEAEYRLVGTHALAVERGFSRKDFDTSGKFNLFSTDSAILEAAREKLEVIAVTPPDYPDIR